MTYRAEKGLVFLIIGIIMGEVIDEVKNNNELFKRICGYMQSLQKGYVDILNI